MYHLSLLFLLNPPFFAIKNDVVTSPCLFDGIIPLIHRGLLVQHLILPP